MTTHRMLPLPLGTLHFIGIGGIGMSGIAEILVNLGYKVQGSDMTENANVRRLRDLGVHVSIGHKAENLDGASVVVTSSAVKPGNVELEMARARLLPVVRRAEMLAELMRLKWSIAVGGTHGKTTTTSLIAALLDAAGLDPTVINGGIINAYGTNARLGEGDWMVVEADESDGTFTKLPATVAAVTNIDPEHLDFYGSFDKVREAFTDFVENIPFYGFAVLCVDHPEVQSLIARVQDRRIITYGLGPQADIRAVNMASSVEGVRFDIAFANRQKGTEHLITGITLPMLGRHNVQNALAAAAIILTMGLDERIIRKGFRTFGGVKRRFTITGTAGGITVIDDYGHHPVEIAAVVGAARAATEGRVIAVIQPHRYSRLQALFEDFCACLNDADVVIVADVYAAGEAPIEGIDRDALVRGLTAHGHRQAIALETPSDLARMIADMAEPGDLVVCLGAGSITNWAQSLPGELEAQLPTPSHAATANGEGGARA